ncbi:Major Facilitator Superfamily protein [Symmachiella dynata]|uniref:MFS transporter n=1 Tax=Symmachiella dynata TaxID=2527995 RepID=UPI001188AC2A|nr:MFS transporter [Symmachiella dynata]QDT50008.1 Major Facilitator Superfamily protein [Symmachiella dynata]
MSRLRTKPIRSRLANPVQIQPSLTPVAPQRKPFFLGWTVLFIAALGMFASAPGQSFSVATFKEPMEASLKVTDTAFSAAYLVATLVSGACLPFVGRLTDRYGARLLLPIIALALGGACLWMSSVESFMGLFIGFCLIRPLGQGSLTLVSSWLVGHWFEKRRGMAMGLLGLGGTLSVMCIPQINQYVTTEFGWRSGWVCLAVIVWAILILPAIVFVRNRPEDVGLLPDGQLTKEEKTAHPQQDLEEAATAEMAAAESAKGHDQTVEEAWKHLTFWKLLMPLCTGALVGTGLVFHQVSIFAEAGLSVTTAVTTLSIQAAAASMGALLFGYLSDRFPERKLMAMSMVCLATAQLLLTSLNHVGLAAIYGMLLGTHGAILRTAGSAVWVNQYGRLHQGAIRGIVLTFQIVASALGPLPFALAKDYWGGYSMANWIMLVLPIGSAIAVWTAYPPKRVLSAIQPPVSTDA